MMVGRLLSFWDSTFSGAMFNFRGVTPFHYFGKPTLSLNFRETQPDWGGSSYTVYCSSFNAEWPETGTGGGFVVVERKVTVTTGCPPDLSSTFNTGLKFEQNEKQKTMQGWKLKRLSALFWCFPPESSSEFVLGKRIFGVRWFKFLPWSWKQGEVSCFRCSYWNLPWKLTWQAGKITIFNVRDTSSNGWIFPIVILVLEGCIWSFFNSNLDANGIRNPKLAMA